MSREARVAVLAVVALAVWAVVVRVWGLDGTLLGPDPYFHWRHAQATAEHGPSLLRWEG